MTPSSPAAAADSSAGSHASHEAALGEVSDVMLNLEHTLARAKKARDRVRKTGGDPNVELALGVLIEDLSRSRKRLMQDTYYAGDALRLL